MTTLLAIYNADDTLRTRFEYADSRMPHKMTHEGQAYYLAYDQVGTLKAISTEDGTIVKTIEYDTFGNVISDSNPVLNIPFGFAGGLYDTDTKLTRFGYRDYDAETGKWTAKDPIEFDGGDTNLYGYVLGDPVNGVDPSGLYDDPRFNRTLPNWNRPIFPPSSIPGKIYNGLSRDIPKMYNNAHPAARACLDVSMTVSEFGLTFGLKGTSTAIYEFYSGANFNTYPTSRAGVVGYIYGNLNDE